MTEHVHDYVIEGNVWRCRHCPSELNIPDVYIRIKATERLSAELIREELGCYAHGWTGWDKLRIAAWAYANILEAVK